MHGNFNILTEEEIKLFENKYKINTHDINTIIVSAGKTKTFYNIYKDTPIKFRVFVSETKEKFLTVSQAAIQHCLILNRILKHFNLEFSVFEIQNTINKLIVSKKPWSTEEIEQELFKKYKPTQLSCFLYDDLNLIQKCVDNTLEEVLPIENYDYKKKLRLENLNEFLKNIIR